MHNPVVGTWVEGPRPWRYFIYDHDALYIEWTKSKSCELSQKIAQLTTDLETAVPIIDYAIGYHSCMIYFDPKSYGHDRLINFFEAYHIVESKKEIIPTLEVPISFGNGHAPDLSYVAESCDLDVEKVVELFLSKEYTVHFMGFMPGFIYMGGLSDQLKLPRRATPRLKVPGGSVAIAAGQTGIYPIEVPGGWHIIGRTEMRFFDVDKSPPSDIIAGTKVRFKAL